MSPRQLLADCRLFAGLDTEALQRLETHCKPIALRSGAKLVDPEQPADALYIVASGRLLAIDASGNTVGEIGHGESVGEIGLFTRRALGFTVRAVRDSVLLRIDRDDFLRFAERHPSALFAMIGVIVDRLNRRQREQQLETIRRRRVFAVVPANPQIDATGFAHRLASALGRFGRVEQVDARRVDAALGDGAAQTPVDGDAQSLIAYLNGLENTLADGYLVYCADADASPWSRRCMRQSDRIVVVARCDEPPALGPMLADVLKLDANAPIELVLLRAPDASAGEVLSWRQRLRTRSHHFVVEDGDLLALARRLSGRAIGLALGGGGARGFAHIGLLRAMAELGLPVDAVAGSSMGAYFGALVACGLDHHQILEVTRDTFVDHNYLNDYTLPRVSLIRGRKFLRRLQAIFGERTLESLWTPFFSVTTNLTLGTAASHDVGPLALWVGTSMAIPGVVAPVAWRGELHADGAVVNSLPTDVLHRLGRGPIVASDVSTRGAIAVPGVEGPDPEALLHQNGEQRISLLDILFRTATLTSETGDAARTALADCAIRMPVEEVGLFEWSRLDELAERGYRHAMDKLSAAADALGWPLREVAASDPQPGGR